MKLQQNLVRSLYRRLIAFYPRTFREELGESMEQTFHDLWSERQQTKKGLFGFVLWTFLETAIGITREYLLLITKGSAVKNISIISGSSALISFILIIPFMIMEWVTHRNFNEEFPVMLFFVMWLNLFAFSLILLPIVLGWRTGNHSVANPLPAQGNTLLTNPRSAALISVALILAPGILPLLNSAGWLSLDRLFNGPNPEVAYLPGQLLSLGFILFPITAGIIASRPIVNTLRAGGSLFAHPINLIIVVFISSTFAIGFASFIIDQMPCFLGGRGC